MMLVMERRTDSKVLWKFYLLVVYAQTSDINSLPSSMLETFKRDLEFIRNFVYDLGGNHQHLLKASPSSTQS